MSGAKISAMPLRVPARPAEPAHGTLSRLAARNGFPSGPALANRLGLRWIDFQLGRHNELVAKLAGLRAQEIAESSPAISAIPRKLDLRGRLVEFGDWRSSPRRICPECLRSDTGNCGHEDLPYLALQYHRFWWDIWSISHCPFHHCKLQEKCPVCLTQLSWTDPALGRCKNGHDLPATTQVVASQSPFSKYLVSGFGLAFLDEPLPLQFSNHHETVRNLELLGLLCLVGCTSRLTRRTRVESARAREIGYSIASSFGSSFHRLLDERMNHDSVSDGLLATYGWVYEYWAYQPERILPEIRSALFDHAVSREVISGLEPRLGPSPAEPTKTLIQVAKDWGCSFETAKREICRAGRLPTGSRRSVATTIVHAMRSDRPCGTRVLARQWSIGRRAVQELVRAGYLEQERRGICPESANAFKKSVLRKLIRRKRPHFSASIAEAAAMRNICSATLLIAILEGNLRAFSCGSQIGDSWLSRIHLDPDEVVRGKQEPMPVTDVGRLLRLHPEAVTQLVNLGAIHRASGRGLCPRSVAAFQRQYVALAELAATVKKSPRSYRSDLEICGISPAFDRPLVRQIIYRRCETAHAL